MPIEEVATIHCYLGQRCVTVNSLRDGIVLWELHHHCSSRQLLSMIPMTMMLLKLSFFFVADPCHCYSYLSETNPNTKHRTWVFEFRALYCDNQLAGGWYRFVGAASSLFIATTVINDSNDYDALKIIIFLRSRSLPLLLIPEWNQSKHKTQDMGIRIPCTVLWQPTRWGMVSFCGSCRSKNANNACASLQMWCRLVRLVYDCSSYGGGWWNSRDGLFQQSSIFHPALQILNKDLC